MKKDFLLINPDMSHLENETAFPFKIGGRF